MRENRLPSPTQLGLDAARQDFTPEELALLETLEISRTFQGDYAVHHSRRYFLLPEEMAVATRFIQSHQRALDGRCK